MGKHGPCYHCGVTSTPLWRNGPPEKPILCNACGSRWRTKGTLVNYTPLHARSEPDEFEDRRVSKVKAISIRNKEAKLLKRKDKYENVVVGSSGGMLGGGGGLVSNQHPNHQSLFKGLDEDTSNRSSSGSAICNSDSCMQLGSADASDLTGPSQSSVVWDTMVPSRKRTCVNRPKQSSSVEKLTRDLYTILHEQQSYFSGSSEEVDLIFESDTPMVSVEIGHGSVLIRHPNSAAREDESEASSLSVVDNKNEAYSWLTSQPSYNANKSGKVLVEMSEMPMDQDQNNRDNDEKLPILVNHNSPLCKIDLKDIINFEVFTSQMTKDEQQQLVNYLLPIDTLHLPNSLKSTFDSPQFKENLFSFQKLLAEGNFDLSAPATKSEGCRTLKRLALYNMTKCKWVEQYNMLQDNREAGVVNTIAPSCSVSVQRSNQFPSFPGLKSTAENPKGVFKKASYEHKELVDNDCNEFSPRSLFGLPLDNSSLMLDYLKYADESCEHDLLLNVPSNTSFPQAELLPTSSFVAQTSGIYKLV